ncbi:MAG: DedA family protein [Acidimicrobiales bacterium]
MGTPGEALATPIESERLLEHLVVSQITRHGYLAVFLLMVLESACIPVPSEAVMLLGGALAAGVTVAGVSSHLNVVVVALLGTAGNIVGALAAYWVGRAGGRPLVERWGRYVLLRRRDLDRAERFFARHGRSAVLVGRVLPVVRTFVSLPAGIAEMPALQFTVLTALGSLPWTFALAFAGYAVAGSWRAVSSAFTPVTIGFGVAIAAAIAWWAVRRVRVGSRLGLVDERGSS